MGGIEDDQFRKIFENNVLSNHWLIQMVAPKMIERKDGAIVIVSSIGGLKGSTVLGAYCVSKAADFQLARNLAAEWGKHNVRVNCIAPGLIKTDFARALWENPDTLKEVTSTSPMRRIGLPDEIAGAAGLPRLPSGLFPYRPGHRHRRRRYYRRRLSATETRNSIAQFQQRPSRSWGCNAGRCCGRRVDFCSRS